MTDNDVGLKKERIASINDEIITLDRLRHKLHEERLALQRSIDFNHYSCQCVELNSMIGIYNMSDQTNRNRNALQMGLVSESLSASRSCTECGGSGVPRQIKGKIK